MRNNGFHDGGYQSRRELRRAYEEWLAQMDVDLFVTLSLAKNIGVDRARRKLRLWLAFVDSHYLGARWTRRPSSERTKAFIFAESVDTNLHYHALMKLPYRGQLESLEVRAATLERFWRKIEWRGTCHVDWVRDAGAAEYVTKQLVRPGYLEQIILANDFHPDRDRSSDEERGDQEGFSEPIIDLS